MKITLKKIKLFGFLSFGDAEFDFRDRGYCLLTGVNKNPRDAAKANGVGKSALSSAICWALTGETIQGLKTNISNIYLNSGCYVALEFDIDSDSYIVTRYKDYDKFGTDLKITLNGKDISGKGIRESQEVLSQYLPDINSQLIASVIILGQGLPSKFSANTPSGRKEVLEKLSKSDFMIQDIKARIEKRSQELTGKIRKNDDELLENKTKLNIFNEQLAKCKNELATLTISTNFDELILKLVNEINELKTSAAEIQNYIDNTSSKLNSIQDKILVESQAKDFKLDEFRQNHDNAQNSYRNELTALESQKISLASEIKKLDAITDICPTCGQKIPNVCRPDTTVQKNQLFDINNKITGLQNIINDDNQAYLNAKIKLDESYKEKTASILNEKAELTAVLNTHSSNLAVINSDIAKKEMELHKIKLDKENHKNLLENTRNQIGNLDKTISEVTSTINKLTDNSSNLNSHLEVINKMNTLVKRDFRGFLLQNIITFIDNKAKEFSEVVFKTRDLDFKLDGNNINILYCNKAFENLSGGEQQRVDLILQFALRDMMSQYLGFSSNVLFLDELFDNLDSQGCDAILELISEKITDVESIFIISHRSSDLGIPCDSEVIIEKNDKGVSTIL